MLISKIKVRRSKRHTMPKVYFQNLVDSIKKEGVKVPIILDQNGKLIDGYWRLLAAKEAGLTDIPVRGISV